MKSSVRHRICFAAAILLLCVLGLWVRRQHGIQSSFFSTYFPDAAWAMAVYCGFGLLFDRGVKLNLPASLAVSYLVELSQCFSPPILVMLRQTTLGGLVLGYGFLWSDIICYTVGALLCAAAERIIHHATEQ